MSSSDTPTKPAYPPTEQLQGIVERITFHSEESGYTVARLKVPSTHDLITIVGSFPDIHAGQTLRLGGYYREHAKYGQQFHAVWAQETKPATLTGLEKYLGSGLIKGIGPVTAKRIVKHFGLDTLEIIEQSCSRLIEVPGIGERRVAMIERAWAVTIHKSQGSEYPVVILPLYIQHYLLLSRNLLYTGLTRAKQLAILVGPPKAIGFAVKRMLNRQRYTALADRLKETEHVFPL